MIRIFILLLSLGLYTTIHSENIKANVLVLPFVNEIKKDGKAQAQYDFLGQKIANEYRLLFSKTNGILLIDPKHIYEQVSILQKSGFSNNEKRIMEMIERMEKREGESAKFTHIVYGTYKQEGNNFFIKTEMKQRSGSKLLTIDEIDQKFPKLQAPELWQLQACSKAIYIVREYFQFSLFDSYTNACTFPQENKTAMEISKRHYYKILELEREYADWNQPNSCAKNCYSEESDDKINACLNSCEYSHKLQKIQLDVARLSISGYVGLSESPVNQEASFNRFKKASLGKIIQILKELPDNANLIVQGRISTKFSASPEVFEKSQKKAQIVLDYLSKEISQKNPDSQDYLKKLKIEACGDICIQDFPSQVDSSGKDNDVTFKVRSE
jgi:hypothetical protein